jgi:hypothetical protein
MSHIISHLIKCSHAWIIGRLALIGFLFILVFQVIKDSHKQIINPSINLHYLYYLLERKNPFSILM